MYKLSCLQCVNADTNINQCKILSVSIDKDSRCSLFTQESKVCFICRKLLVSRPILIQSNDEYKYICNTCRETILNTCRVCENSLYCAFEQDPSPIPKTVVKTFQQNGMTIQQQIPNPSRRQITCEKCQCFSQEFGCCRENTYCKNYKEIDL